VRTVHPWWLRYPDRWTKERTDLTEAGWDWTVDRTDADRGIIALSVRRPRGSDACQTTTRPDTPQGTGEGSEWKLPPGAALTIRYPAAYPFFPCVIHDPRNTLGLSRHRDPRFGHLCLLHARDWDVRTTAAKLLADQLPRILEAAGTTDETIARRLEEPLPEPTGLQVPISEGLIMVDGAWVIPPDVMQGALFPHNVLGRWLRYPNFRQHLDSGLGLQTLWAQAQSTLRPLQVEVREHSEVPATPLMETEDADTGKQPDGQLHDEAVAAAPHAEPTPSDNPPDRGPVTLEDSIQVIGLLVPSETRYRQPGEEWLFLVRSQLWDEPDPVLRLLRSSPFGITDTLTRSPATATAPARRVLIAGVGALGSTLALELARAGIGHLDLIDHDIVEPATSCRQIAPAIWAGLPKSAVLKQVLAENNPHTHVRAHPLHIGADQTQAKGAPDVHTALVHLVSHADLVIDTAADPAVTRYLATISRVTGVTLLHAAGAACWWCLLHHRHDRTVPFPPAAPDEEGTVAPLGCAEPTFAGTSADLNSIAVHAARVALDHLTTTSPATPRMRGDLYVASLRDHRDRPIPTRWRTRTLTRHPACPMHGNPPAATSTTSAAVTAQPARPTTVADRTCRHDRPQLENSTAKPTAYRAGLSEAGDRAGGGVRTETGHKRR
jgi:hypothetical protein